MAEVLPSKRGRETAATMREEEEDVNSSAEERMRSPKHLINGQARQRTSAADVEEEGDYQFRECRLGRMTVIEGPVDQNSTRQCQLKERPMPVVLGGVLSEEKKKSMQHLDLL